MSQVERKDGGHGQHARSLIKASADRQSAHGLVECQMFQMTAFEQGEKKGYLFYLGEVSRYCHDVLKEDQIHKKRM